MKNIRSLFGANLQARRKALGLTQAELAERTGLSVDTIGSLERGKAGGSFEAIAALTEALNTHPAELFGGRPLVPGKGNLPLQKIVDQLAAASPAELKKVEAMVKVLLGK